MAVRIEIFETYFLAAILYSFVWRISSGLVGSGLGPGFPEGKRGRDRARDSTTRGFLVAGAEGVDGCGGAGGCLADILTAPIASTLEGGLADSVENFDIDDRVGLLPFCSRFASALKILEDDGPPVASFVDAAISRSGGWSLASGCL